MSGGCASTTPCKACRGTFQPCSLHLQRRQTLTNVKQPRGYTQLVPSAGLLEAAHQSLKESPIRYKDDQISNRFVAAVDPKADVLALLARLPRVLQEAPTFFFLNSREKGCSRCTLIHDYSMCHVISTWKFFVSLFISVFYILVLVTITSGIKEHHGGRWHPTPKAVPNVLLWRPWQPEWPWVLS